MIIVLCIPKKAHLVVLENHLLKFEKNKWLLYPRSSWFWWSPHDTENRLHKMELTSCCLPLCKWLEVDWAKCPQLGNSCQKSYTTLSTSLVRVTCSAEVKITEMKEYKNKKDFVGLTHKISVQPFLVLFWCQLLFRGRVNCVALLTMSHNSQPECPGDHLDS